MSPKNARQLTHAQAINDALTVAMSNDPNVIIVGEGVPDPKGIFGTTNGLQLKFGTDRVFDMPLSENGMTGICIGAALSGMRPVMVHQRIEFALLAMDQIVNNAAKWNYMFNGENQVPMVIRMIVGRGWGQGPQHSQSLQSLFAHIPGLCVVMPVSSHDVKGMLIAAIEDNNPVIMIEHRWLHPVVGEVPRGHYTVPLNKAKIVKPGNQITIAAFSYMVVEAMRAAESLSRQGIDAEVIDMRSVRPLDYECVLQSVRKTGRLIVADTGHLTNGISSELLARVVEHDFESLRCAPLRIASPDFPVPTSHHAADDYYPDAAQIATAVLSQCGVDDATIAKNIAAELQHNYAKDVPNPQFCGPF